MREQALLHGSFGSLLLTTGISAAIPLGMRMRAEAKKKVAVRQWVTRTRVVHPWNPASSIAAQVEGEADQRSYA
jgi:hypothetical protein